MSFLQSVLRKVNAQDAQQIASPIMDALLQMLSLGGTLVSGVQEDALMAIGTLVEGLLINKHFNCQFRNTEITPLWERRLFLVWL